MFENSRKKFRRLSDELLKFSLTLLIIFSRAEEKLKRKSFLEQTYFLSVGTHMIRNWKYDEKFFLSLGIKKLDSTLSNYVKSDFESWFFMIESPWILKDSILKNSMPLYFIIWM